MSLNGELIIENFSAGYGQIQVIRDLSLTVPSGEITVLLGRNGAGKTTLLSALSGLLSSTGDVTLGGESLSGAAYVRLRQGISLVQEGKRIFRERTVEENLIIGGYSIRKDKARLHHEIEKAYNRFPILNEKKHLSASSLSGGQQQMLAIAQALMVGPRVLMLDEPSAGLSPALVKEVFGEVRNLREDGLTVILVEQLVDNSLNIADWVAVLDNGKIVHHSHVSELKDRSILRKSYMGV